MEDVLAVYAREYDENSPVVCMDEKPYHLVDHTREPIPMEKGNVCKQDYQYIRNGMCSIFIFTEPLSSWRLWEKSSRIQRDLRKSIILSLKEVLVFRQFLLMQKRISAIMILSFFEHLINLCYHLPTQAHPDYPLSSCIHLTFHTNDLTSCSHPENDWAIVITAWYLDLIRK